LGALRRGLGHPELKSNKRSDWQRAENELTKDVQKHWSESLGVVRNLGPVHDYNGNLHPEDGSDYDSSASLAVIHADLKNGPFNVMDERIWATLWEQEHHFSQAYPLNHKKPLGPGIGRNRDDDYYGGNAWFFITAAFAEWSYRVAGEVSSQKGEVTANPRRLATLSRVLQRTVLPKESFKLPNESLASAFALQGSHFLQTMLEVIPPDGSVAEQFHKENGSPVSAHDLTWSYTSVLTAILQREAYQRSTVDFSRVRFDCPAAK
jgi:glucoamylase